MSDKVKKNQKFKKITRYNIIRTLERQIGKTDVSVAKFSNITLKFTNKTENI